MRLVTWNINGIRSLKVDWKDVLSSLDADIICLQETKVTSKFFFKVASKSISELHVNCVEITS